MDYSFKELLFLGIIAGVFLYLAYCTVSIPKWRDKD